MSGGWEKQLNILDYALSSLWRRKLKNASVLVVFSVVIFLLASFQMTSSALTAMAARTLAHAPEITVQHIVAGRQEGIPLRYGQEIQGLFGIRAVVPRIWGYYFDEVHGANYTFLGLDLAEMELGEQLGESLAQGRAPGAGEILLGSGASRTMGVGERKTISLYRPDLTLKSFQVTGEFNPVTDPVTSDMLVTTLAEGRDLFQLPAEVVTDLCVYIANPAEIETIAKKIAALLPGCRVVTRAQIQKTYQVVFGWRSGFASICLLTALVAFIILAWDKASGLSPEERREIAILKILGWQTADVLVVRFWESITVGLLSFFAGCTAAYLHVVFGGAALFRPVMLGWSVLDPRLHLIPANHLSDFLLTFCLSVLPFLAATVIPAWRCAIVPADSAMQG